MKQLLSILLLIFVAPAMVEHKPAYIKLNKDAFFKLDASKVTEVNIVSVEGKEPDEWVGIYRHIFPIRDRQRIDTIIRCIRDADFDAQYRYADRRIMAIEVTIISVDPNDTAIRKEKRRDDFVVINPDQIDTIIDMVRKNKSWDHSGTSKEISSDKILFRTDEAIYFTGIGWESEIFYGDWWISPELRQCFEQWGMFIFDPYVEWVNQKPPESLIDTCVAKMTESFNLSHRTGVELQAQAKWALRHLGQCIKLLEKERGLEPIPVKSEYGYEDPNYPMMPPESLYGQESVPFCLPYEKLSYHEDTCHINIDKETDLARLIGSLNLKTMSVRMSRYWIDQQIRNYEERLQRLDPNSVQENSENLSR